MIEILPESQGNVLGVKGIDKLTDQDYKEVLIPKLEEILKEYGKCRFVFVFGENFHGWELGAAWDDAKFGMSHKDDFEKIAVVSDAKWIEWSTKVSGHFMQGQLKTYKTDQLQEAWDWTKS